MLYLDYAKKIGDRYILNFFANSIEDIAEVSNGKRFVTKNGTDYGVPLASSIIVITEPDKTKKTYLLGEDGIWKENPTLSNLLPPYKYILSSNSSYLFNPLWLINIGEEERERIYNGLTFQVEKDKVGFRTTERNYVDESALGKLEEMGGRVLLNVTLGDLQLMEGYKTSWFNNARDKMTLSWPSIRILCKSSIVKSSGGSIGFGDWVLVISNIESKNTPEELVSLCFDSEEHAAAAGFKYLTDVTNYDSTDFCILASCGEILYSQIIVKTKIDSLVTATCFIDEVV